MSDTENRRLEHDDEILSDRLGRMDDELDDQKAPDKLQNQIKGTYGGTRGVFSLMDLIYKLFADLGKGLLSLFEPEDKK